MSSQAEIEDAILARRLQSEEFSLQQREASQHRTGGASSTTQLSDEELARRLDQEERRMLQRTPSQSINTNGQVALQTGQTMPVKLHHLMTHRQIGEVLLAHHVSIDEMVFELANTPGKYLKAKETGIVEFDIVMDNRAIFKVSNSIGGQLFMLNKAFITTPNRTGAIGWYLSMSAAGHLTCNGARDSEAEWTLLAAPQQATALRTQLPPTPAVAAPMNLVMASNGAVTSSGAAIYSSATPPNGVMQPTQNQSNPNGFPGLGAGKDELMKFFATPQGQAFLGQSEYKSARDLYLAKGALANILHRPDWPLVANRYRDITSIPLDVDNQLVDIMVSAAQFRHFFEHGYTVLPSMVPMELVRDALKMTNYWQFKYAGTPLNSANGMKRGANCVMQLVGDITHDCDLLALYYQSALPHVLQRMMGEGEVMHPTSCQVITSYPCVEIMDNPALLGNKWNIEGFTTAGGHSPYNVLLGIALTDISEVDMGNFCVHPGSHLSLLEQYHKQAEMKQALFSSNPYSVQKPDLGEPVQLKLKAGDVFLCTQRLAHLFTMNTSSMPTSIAYFRVSNIDHAVLKDPALFSIWLEYKYASKYMDSELENRSILHEATPSPQSAYQAPVPAPFPPSNTMPLPSPMYSSSSVSALPPPPATQARPSAVETRSPFTHEALMAQPASHFQVVGGELSSPVSTEQHWQIYNPDDDSCESTPLFAPNDGSDNRQARDTHSESSSFLYQRNP